MTKRRDPYASSLAKPQYHQRQIPDARHKKRQKVERRERQEDSE